MFKNCIVSNKDLKFLIILIFYFGCIRYVNAEEYDWMTVTFSYSQESTTTTPSTTTSTTTTTTTTTTPEPTTTTPEPITTTSTTTTTTTTTTEPATTTTNAPTTTTAAENPTTTTIAVADTTTTGVGTTTTTVHGPDTTTTALAGGDTTTTTLAPGGATTTTVVVPGGTTTTVIVPGGETTTTALYGGATTTTTLPAGVTTTTVAGGEATTTTVVVPGGTTTTVVPGGETTTTTVVPGGPTTTTVVVPGGTTTTVIPGGETTTTTVVPGGPTTTTVVVPGGDTTTTTVSVGVTTTTVPSGGATTTTVIGGQTTTTVPGSCSAVWSEWTTISDCTDACGGCGEWTRTRTCTSTSAACTCSGPATVTEPCNFRPCTYPRSSCCDNRKAALQNRQIVCVDAPIVTTIAPNPACCPSSGGIWSEWSQSGSCSDTCGGYGTATHTRTCLTSSFCPCIGSSTKSDVCNIGPCSYPRNSCRDGYKLTGVDIGNSRQLLCKSTTASAPTTTTQGTLPASCFPSGGLLNNWSDWSSCTDTCGGCGTQTRARACASAAYGVPCTSGTQTSQSQTCNQNPCTYPRNACCQGRAQVSNRKIVCL